MWYSLRHLRERGSGARFCGDCSLLDCWVLAIPTSSTPTVFLLQLWLSDWTSGALAAVFRVRWTSTSLLHPHLRKVWLGRLSATLGRSQVPWTTEEAIKGFAFPSHGGLLQTIVRGRDIALRDHLVHLCHLHPVFYAFCHPSSRSLTSWLAVGGDGAGEVRIGARGPQGAIAT